MTMPTDEKLRELLGAATKGEWFIAGKQTIKVKGDPKFGGDGWIGKAHWNNGRANTAVMAIGKEAIAEVLRLRAALQKIADGDTPRPVAAHWFPNESPTKLDRCSHMFWMYEDCPDCISDFARTALLQEVTK